MNQISELVLIHVPLTLEPKSTISPNHIQLLNKNVQQYDLKMILQDWTLDGDKRQNKTFQDHIQLLSYKKIEVDGEFRRTLESLNWAATPAPTPIRPLREPPP